MISSLYKNPIGKAFILGMTFSFTLVACASFPYKWWVWGDSKLLDPEGNGDKPFSYCKPDAFGNKCIVMELEPFRQMRLERDQLKEELKKCQNPDVEYIPSFYVK